MWTGSELLVWAGVTRSSDAGSVNENTGEGLFGDPAVWDGAGYNPGTGAWRVIADGPVPAGGEPTQTIPQGVWTGGELVIWGGWGEPIAAAYDPAADTWRDLPVGPLGARQDQGMVFLDGEMFVFGGRTATRDGGPDRRDGAALDLSTGAWRPIPDLPDRYYVSGATAGAGQVVALLGSSYGRVDPIVVALAPGDRQWRMVASGSGPITGQPAVAGGRVSWPTCGFHEPPRPDQVLSVDVSSGTVESLALPVEGECPGLTSFGDEVLAITRIDGDEFLPDAPLRVHRLAGAAWQELDPPPTTVLGPGTWTGAEFLFWGVCDCRSGYGGSATEAGYRFAFD